MTILNSSSIRYDARVIKEASSLQKAGNEVFLIAVAHKDDFSNIMLDGINVTYVHLRSNKLPKIMLRWIIKYIEFNLKSFMKMVKIKADVYHSHDLYPLIISWIAARITGKWVVYDSHELFTERPIEAKKMWKMIEMMLIKRVDKVIAASDERAEVMYNEYNTPQLPTVIMNCPSYRTVNDLVGQGSTLRLSLPEQFIDKKILIYQGAISENRCLKKLIKSVVYLRDDIILVLLGKKTNFAQNTLSKLIQDNYLENRVIMCDPVDYSHLIEYISGCDLGVVIYKNNCRNNYLCAPNKMFDYCMSRLPVIGSNFPSIRRVVNDFNVGCLFDPEDEKSISNAVHDVLDGKVYRQMKNNTDRVARQFNWENEEKKLLRLYRGFSNCLRSRN